MLKKKPTLFILMVIVVSSAAHAKSIYPAEIMGRSLGVLGLGQFGHVGIATADMLSSKGMLQPATQVIEVLNENPVGQINSIANFKSRSKYWGVNTVWLIWVSEAIGCLLKPIISVGGVPVTRKIQFIILAKGILKPAR